MKPPISNLALLVAAGAVICLPGFAQQVPERQSVVPLYRVNVVERSVKAINYEYRSGPTEIEFRGTVLLPKAKGGATVESKRGHTEIDAKFDRLDVPQTYGREYLTYVLWAITPQGRPHNLGEVVTGTSDDAHLHVSTDLQAFALIVTAEPHSAVRQPSDVVVMENEVGPYTTGRIESVEARFELMPRGQYTYNVDQKLDAAVANAPKVSMKQYEALLQLYEAQNALGIAQAAGADRYAATTFQKATTLLDEARNLSRRKGNERRVVQSAREAAQTAEDARLIAVRRQQDDSLSAARADAANARSSVNEAQITVEQARQQLLQAQARAEAASAQAQTAQAQAESERSARAAAEVRAAQAVADARIHEQAAASAISQQQQSGERTTQQTQSRRKLLADLSPFCATLDSPRGVVVTLPGSGFNGENLRGSGLNSLAHVATIVARDPRLRIEIQGYSATDADSPVASYRADLVRRTLASYGMPVAYLSASGLGTSRPVVSNATAEGREQNTRIELVITGDTIGTLPTWDRTYPLTNSLTNRPPTGAN